jgi:hypothetical protein
MFLNFYSVKYVFLSDLTSSYLPIFQGKDASATIGAEGKPWERATDKIIMQRLGIAHTVPDGRLSPTRTKVEINTTFANI